MAILFAFLIILLFFSFGFALHLLWIVAAVLLLLLWLVGFGISRWGERGSSPFPLVAELSRIETGPAQVCRSGDLARRVGSERGATSMRGVTGKLRGTPLEVVSVSRQGLTRVSSSMTIGCSADPLKEASS